MARRCDAVLWTPPPTVEDCPGIVLVDKAPVGFPDPFGYFVGSEKLRDLLFHHELEEFTGRALRVSLLVIAKQLNLKVGFAELRGLAEGLRVMAELMRADAEYFSSRADMTEAARLEREALRLIVLAQHAEHEAAILASDDDSDILALGLVEPAMKAIALKAGETTYAVAQWVPEAVAAKKYPETFTHLAKRNLIKNKVPSPPAPSNPMEALNLAVTLRDLLHGSRQPTNNKGYEEIVNITVPGALEPEELVLSAMQDVSGKGQARQDRNEAAHQIRFRTFLVLAIREFQRAEGAGVSPSPEWKNLFDLFHKIHGFSLTSGAQATFPHMRTRQV